MGTNSRKSGARKLEAESISSRAGSMGASHSLRLGSPLISSVAIKMGNNPHGNNGNERVLTGTLQMRASKAAWSEQQLCALLRSMQESFTASFKM